MKPRSWISVFIGLVVFTMSLTAFADIQDTKTSKQMQFSRLPSGQYIVHVYVNEKGPLNFMVDTAATRSSLFQRTANKLDIAVPGEHQRMVNGIIVSKERPLVQVQSLRFAEVDSLNHDMILLEDWEQGYASLDGILGMDIMDGLVLVFKHKNNSLAVANKAENLKKSYRKWTRTNLESNPYGGTDYGLKFTKTEIQGTTVPVILDLGSAFSAINWQAVRNPKIKKLKSRLREEWQVQGAVGKFVPTARIRINYLEVGNLAAKDTSLIIMDLDNLPVNNFGKEPLMLMGTDFIAGRDFALDFENDRFFVKKGKIAKKEAVIDTVYPGRLRKRDRSP